MFLSNSILRIYLQISVRETIILHYGATLLLPLPHHLDTLASSEATSNISLATTCKMGGTNFVLFLALTVTFGVDGQVSAQYNKDVAKYLPGKPCNSIRVSASPTQSKYQLPMSLCFDQENQWFHSTKLLLVIKDCLPTLP